MRQDVTHFQISAVSNEDHVAKQPSVSFHDNLLGFPLAGLFFIVVKVFNFIFLMGSWKQYPVCIRCCSNSLYACSPFSRAANKSVDTSGDATVPLEMLTRLEGSFQNCFPRDRPLKQRPTHLSLCGSFQDQCAL